jgi:hypothetical protein
LMKSRRFMSPRGTLTPSTVAPRCIIGEGAYMSPSGHSRRFCGRPSASGLPRSTDITRPARLVRFVPIADLTTQQTQLLLHAQRTMGCFR